MHSHLLKEMASESIIIMNKALQNKTLPKTEKNVSALF